MLCHCCANIDLDKLISTEGLQHHINLLALKLSAELGCRLCTIVRDLLPPGQHPQDLWNSQIVCRAAQWSFSEEHPDAFSSLEFTPLKVQMGCFTEPHSPLSNLVCGRPVASSSRSEIAFRTASNWIAQCFEKHQLCINKSSLMPTRIIHVSQEQGYDAQLVACDGLRGQWVILSHCWGSQRHGITTTSNLEDRKQRIDVESLPVLYQDAIAITRKLGYQYLWIDSLCIIQDSPSDWRQESMQMDAYYTGAVLNISARAASDSSQGIFSTADEGRLQSESILAIDCRSGRQNLKGLVQLRKLRPAKEHGNDHLHKRAWVLQEYVLSPRILEFWGHELRWQCNTSYCEESRPEMASPKRIGPPFSKTLNGFKQEQGISTGPSGVKPLAWWYYTVNDYIGRTLTFPDDRLPGIAGLAKEFAARTGLTYICGIWQEDLIRGLGWNAYGMKVKTNFLTSPPSWSWVSVAELKLPPVGPGRGRIYYQGPWEAHGTTELVQVQIRNEDDDLFGQVQSARLTLRGEWGYVNGRRLSRVFFHPGRLGSRFDDEPGIEPSIKPGEIVCFLDESPGKEGHSREKLNPRTIYFQLGWWKKPSPTQENPENVLHALILEPAEGEEDVYRRIGIAEIPYIAELTPEWRTGTVVIV